jgi:hypothetical protein
MNAPGHPTSATQAKDRLYGQISGNLTRMSHALSQTADLFEHLQVDLDAMRVLAGLHAAQCDTSRSLSFYETLTRHLVLDS